MNYYYKDLKYVLKEVSLADGSHKVSNRELYERVKNVSDISVNVFMLEAPSYSSFSRTEHDIFPDSNVYIKGKINEANYDFEFSARTPKKEITVTWLLNQIQADYMKYQKRTAEMFGKPFDKTKAKENVIKVFKTKLGYGWFYVTEYGIGMERLFLPVEFEAQLRQQMSDFLKSQNVKFQNEYSEAHWVLRFLISKDYKFHNQLLEKFKAQDK